VSATRHLRRRRAHLAAVVTGLAFCAPAATAMAQPADMGNAIPAGHSAPVVVTPSPDARDAALAATSATPAVRPDPRSPDARDAAVAAKAATPAVRPDPRSPDARDAADPARGLRGAPVPAASSVVVREDSDTTLPLALAGAALAFALLAAAGVGFTARSRRQPVSVGH
jgi:hypothetical protein